MTRKRNSGSGIGRDSESTPTGATTQDPGEDQPAPLSLELYRQKRDPGQTPEPFEDTASNSVSTRQGEFVVHHHAARSRHFDLRLEVGGALLSFAVPKGPSLDPTQKRLAVMTEPHPRAYLDFEDVIPEGNYGAGAMIVWDRGGVRYLERAAEEGLREHKLDFVLAGYKLRGRFALIQTGHRNGNPNHWLLVKKKDAFCSELDPTEADPTSIYSGRTVDELPNKEAWAAEVHKRAASFGAKKLSSPIRAASLRPMLCERPQETIGNEDTSALLSRQDHLYELKLDGVRIVAQKTSDHATLYFRSGRPAHARFPEIQHALRKLPVESLVLDGELVALGPDGKPAFAPVASRLHRNRRSDPIVRSPASHDRVTYWVFDLLALGSWDLRSVPLAQRKALLQELIPRRGPVAYLDHIEGQGHALFEFCKQEGLEGVVCKRAASSYQAGERSLDWIKIKRGRESEFVVVGYTLGSGGRKRLGALELAAFQAGELTLFGRVGSGMSEEVLSQLLSSLEPLRRSELVPASGTLAPAPEGEVFVEPQLVVTVRHLGLSSAGRLRFPVFVRVRIDKAPSEAVWEEGIESDAKLPEAGAPDDETAGHERNLPDTRPKHRVSLSNQGKVFFPQDGITKGNLCRYFERIAPVMLPYLRERPTVLVRYPDGIEGKFFYQWRAPAKAPSWLRSVPLPGNPKKGEKTAFVIDSLDALLFVANLGCIPLHIFAHTVGKPASCQFATLDFDIGRGTLRDAVIMASELLVLLDSVLLPGFVKTSGQSGVHVHIALGDTVTFAAARQLVDLLARLIFTRFPKRATLERRKDKRGDRVLLDTGQVGLRRTVVAPYSPRAVPGARVSTPITRSELNPTLDPGAFTIGSVLERVEAIGDPMRPLLESRPDMEKALRHLADLVPKR